MSAPSPLPASSASARVGVIAAIVTFGTWGLLPIYLKQLASLPPPEVLSHRVVWSVVTMIALTALLRGWRKVREALGSRRAVLVLFVTSALISANWLTYIYAVSSGQILQASMGYFINPLISVLFGFVFLKETMARRQWVAVALAATGVAFLVIRLGEFPTIALTLAISFATYGLLRKTIPVDGASGMLVESVMIGPFALGYLLWLESQGSGHFGHVSPWLDVLMILGGPITALPLMLFGVAVRRVRLSTIGLIQYITPSGQFLLATQLYDEPFTTTHAWAFSCIWLGLAIYSAPRGLLRRVGFGGA